MTREHRIIKVGAEYQLQGRTTWLGVFASPWDTYGHTQSIDFGESVHVPVKADSPAKLIAAARHRLSIGELIPIVEMVQA